MPEYINIFSSLMAAHYGAPLNGYLGVNENNDTEQIMDRIASTAFSEMENFRLFAHIKVISYTLVLARVDLVFFL